MNNKIKITHEGQPCRKCNTPVVRRSHDSEKLRIMIMNAEEGDYYFEYWFRCPNCKTTYFIEAAKRYYKDNDNYFLNVRIFYSDEDEGFIATSSNFNGISGFGTTKELAMIEYCNAMKGALLTGMKL